MVEKKKYQHNYGKIKSTGQWIIIPALVRAGRVKRLGTIIHCPVKLMRA